MRAPVRSLRPAPVLVRRSFRPAALHLYDIYLQFKNFSIVDTLLAKLYELGRVYSFVSLEPADMDDVRVVMARSV